MDYEKLADHRNNVAKSVTLVCEELQINHGSIHPAKDYNHFLKRNAFDKGCQYLQSLDAILLSEQCCEAEGE